MYIDPPVIELIGGNNKRPRPSKILIFICCLFFMQVNGEKCKERIKNIKETTLREVLVYYKECNLFDIFLL